MRPPRTGSLPVGQDTGSDLVRPDPQWSQGRLHSQRFNGIERVHRDTFDPDKGPAHMVLHGFFDVLPALVGRIPVVGKVFKV